MTDTDDLFSGVRHCFCDALQLQADPASFTPDTPLVGNLPELDSMAVLTVLTAFEDEYGFVIDDDDVSADTFETMGSLVEFVRTKLATV